eukprot:2339111-Pyramimonas_sp.AAC.1
MVDVSERQQTARTCLGDLETGLFGEVNRLGEQEEEAGGGSVRRLEAPAGGSVRRISQEARKPNPLQQNPPAWLEGFAGGDSALPSGLQRHAAMQCEHPFEESLTARESKNLKAYRERQPAP